MYVAVDCHEESISVAKEGQSIYVSSESIIS